MAKRRVPDPVRQIKLEFSGSPGKSGNALHKDLSAVARVGDCLFVAADEAAKIKRLIRRGKHFVEDCDGFPLAAFFSLPDTNPDAEMDIEGLSFDGRFLWVVGSHALKRQKPEERFGAGALAEMKTTIREDNRFVLARIPLRNDGDVFTPVEKVGELAAASLRIAGKSVLVDLLSGDPHLKDFLHIPSKENGLDIEGIAVRGQQVWLGLRGPVLSGHAVVVRIDMDEVSPELLEPCPFKGDQSGKYLLDTKGLGIRDLLLDGDDLLLLVGPTMALDGPARVLRWRGGAREEASTVVDPDAIETVVELPYEHKYDHPESLERWPEEGKGALLVIYDAPSKKRMKEKNGRRIVLADVFKP
jgi:Protein of unknown function (DUF3616)